MSVRIFPSRLALTACLAVAVACSGADIRLPVEIGSDIDVDGLFEELRDCGTLSDTFVAVVREAAGDLDELSERTGDRVPAAELAEKVDLVVDNAYFEVAERLGCDAVAQRVDTIERLRRLSPDSAAGEELVEEVIDELESRRG